MSTRSWAMPNRLSCPWNKRRSSSWPSTARRRKRSAWPSRRQCRRANQIIDPW